MTKPKPTVESLQAELNKSFEELRVALESKEELRKEMKNLKEQLEELQKEADDLQYEADAHKDCPSDDTVAEWQEMAEAAEKFGQHTNCLFGFITGRELHPDCTCGWNDIVTQFERRRT